METTDLPPLFIERLRCIMPDDKNEHVLRSFSFKRPISIRVNTLKANPLDIRTELEQEGIRLEAIAWFDAAFILKSGEMRVLQATKAYQNGAIYVQGLSSMLVPILLNAQPDEYVLDMTAAPGSKTTQIAAMMRSKGSLTANDYHRSRFYKLKNNLKLQGAAFVRATLKRGEAWGRSHAGVFDRILLDAPCSSEGRFSVFEKKSFRFWKPAKIKEMAGKQGRLFPSAVYALKPGGTLVYSTCTFAPEENEAILDRAKKKFGDEIEVLDPVAEFKEIFDKIPNRIPGIDSWKGKQYHPEAKKAVRILPDELMEGFFMALIRKKV